ncbi:MAG: NTP transferase domain-containing protein [Clostridia bacterium]|nr:NTP transferase domain-containing protein [Clostridia bacterium]
MTLLILAAGLGSRFGGMKQTSPVGPCGEFIIDYSCADAIKAGFNRIVFVIKKENLEIFRDSVGKRVEPYCDVRYAFQDLRDLPQGFSLPEGRVKPWGTAHALLAARNIIDDNFATINADDFYGAESFSIVADFLKKADEKNGVMKCCMAGYRLSNTLTENGSVSRGICDIAPDGKLVSITERTKITPVGADAEFEEDGSSYPLPGSSIASMNFFGLTPGIFDFAEKKFSEFLSDMKNPMKDEFYLPFMVSDAMKQGIATVNVLPTEGKWFGVTYAADKPSVVKAIAGMTEKGIYAEDLWKGIGQMKSFGRK